MSKLKILLIALGAVGLWIASRATWLTVNTLDDKSGSATNELVGAVWAPEITALALVLLAGCVATLIMGSIGRRIVGVISAAAAIVASWSPMQLLSQGEDGVDRGRALDLLTSGSATQRANAPVTVADWAQVESLQVHTLGAIGALVASALALVGGVMLLVRPGSVKKQKSSAYENPEVRKQRIREDLENDPQSGRVLWDALDAGVDPTDNLPENLPTEEKK